ncbi:MAG TPA: GxxExxY protein [Anaerolineales bacterium]|nr:GxxExxY protein [Anaerolineales bacterium]
MKYVTRNEIWNVNKTTEFIIGAAIEVHRLLLGPGLLESNYEECVVESILPIHEAQTFTYMKPGGWKVGLILNFNGMILKNGIKRLVYKIKE